MRISPLAQSGPTGIGTFSRKSDQPASFISHNIKGDVAPDLLPVPLKPLRHFLIQELASSNSRHGDAVVELTVGIPSALNVVCGGGGAHVIEPKITIPNLFVGQF